MLIFLDLEALQHRGIEVVVVVVGAAAGAAAVAGAGAAMESPQLLQPEDDLPAAAAIHALEIGSHNGMRRWRSFVRQAVRRPIFRRGFPSSSVSLGFRA